MKIPPTKLSRFRLKTSGTLFSQNYLLFLFLLFLLKSNLIHPDSIREGKSLEQLRTMKGNEGLANMLKINLKVSFCFIFLFLPLSGILSVLFIKNSKIYFFLLKFICSLNI